MEEDKITKNIKLVVNLIFTGVFIWLGINNPQLWIIYGIFVIWYLFTGIW